MSVHGQYKYVFKYLTRPERAYGAYGEVKILRNLKEIVNFEHRVRYRKRMSQLGGEDCACRVDDFDRVVRVS
ncbi:hypothetical protein CY34DRAFT_799569 [Suillus luteus UH-Slu-Lm8-n1]|uniref:Uncharacterized protein n=1 Tax=Suillus luteus UH-Slu-Lm8-n1 TaxID=930992 RepID=A0A0D0BN04_9AGAM|nr:hypothetical protein CY34DRAFT_799569 [Suillus luteus UH-Slu-Lm8-n1]